VEGANRIYRGGSHRSMPAFIESLDPARKKDRVRRMKTGYHNRAGGAKFSTFPRSLSDDGIDEGHFSEFC
jgi:hypothetical protein